MKSLPRPTTRVGEVIDAFGHGPRVDFVHARRDELVAAESVYEAFAAGQSSHSIPRRPTGLSAVEAATVSWAYEQHFRHRDGGGRSVYSFLRNSASSCPICRIREVSALDHYLPRDSYPAYAIQPLNLVPICSSCNYAKLDATPGSRQTLFLHPYFDDLDGDGWLSASVVARTGFPVVFGVDAAHFTDAILHSRVVAHVEFFGIAGLYAKKAGTYIGGQHAYLDGLLRRRGAAAVSDYLFELGDSVLAYGAEPWIGLALHAWAADEAFCTGGWRG